MIGWCCTWKSRSILGFRFWILDCVTLARQIGVGDLGLQQNPQSQIPNPKSEIQKVYGFNFEGTFFTSLTPFFAASVVLSAADLVTSTALFAAFLVSSTTLSVVLFAALPALFMSFA